MLLYDYACSQCGPFQLFRRVADRNAIAVCPECGNNAARLMTAPFLADMNPHTRIAHQRNEKSSHEPQVMSRRQLDHAGAEIPHVCAHDHGHHGHETAGGWVKSDRPWMIGH